MYDDWRNTCTYVFKFSIVINFWFYYNISSKPNLKSEKLENLHIKTQKMLRFKNEEKWKKQSHRILF